MKHSLVTDSLALTLASSSSQKKGWRKVSDFSKTRSGDALPFVFESDEPDWSCEDVLRMGRPFVGSMMERPCGGVFFMGNVHFGQAGGFREENCLSPVPVDVSEVVSLSAGGRHAAAVKSTKVTCLDQG